MTTRVQRGDKVAVGCSERTNMAERDKMRQHLEDTFPGVLFVIVPGLRHAVVAGQADAPRSCTVNADCEARIHAPACPARRPVPTARPEYDDDPHPVDGGSVTMQGSPPTKTACPSGPAHYIEPADKPGGHTMPGA